MEFKEYLELSRSRIVKHLKSYCYAKKHDNLPILFKEQKFIDSLEEFVLRGKLLRGSLFLMTIEGLGGKLNKTHLDTACAIEFMHSALLIQDDIIDNDYERRGDKTIFAKYEMHGKKIGALDNYHYGISSAIVVADVAFFYAVDLLAGFDGPLLSKIIKFYSTEVYKVVLAEGADSVFGQTKKEPTVDEIKSVYFHKTARYTFSLPFEMGVLFTKGNERTRENLSRLGELVGIIFQIKDDEIGLFGEEKEIGKPTGSDIRENKKTLIRYYLYEKASVGEKKILNNCFGNNNLSKKDLEKVKEIYKKHRIQKIIDKQINEIMTEVWKLYKVLPFDKKYMKILKGLLEFNLSRSK